MTGSFAKINILDLTTFVGDVARVKIFRKSQSDLADYQFIQEIQLESNELLIDLESQIKNQEFYGIFDKENFKLYIESKFTEEMSWENYGEWHLDHIKPLYLSENEEDLLLLNHYTNLQPLWAEDNLRKNRKYD